MTTTSHRADRRSHLTFGGVLNSEWIKLTTLRSTLWCYAILIVLMIGLGILLALLFPAHGPLSHSEQQSTFVRVATLGIGFGQLVTAVLGALMITGEYGTGMIRSTLAAVPKRLPALFAKAIVFGVTTFVVALITIFATALITLPLLPNVGIHPDLGDPNVYWPLIGGAGYLALIGLLALSIGALIRNSAGGIAASLGLILVVPAVLQIFASLTRTTWAANLLAFLPDSAGGRIYAYMGQSAARAAVAGAVTLNAWQGLLVLVGWVVVLYVISAILLKLRDA
jgi:ABC-2 type transport system permease protein